MPEPIAVDSMADEASKTMVQFGKSPDKIKHKSRASVLMDDLAENNPRRSTSNPMLLSPKVDQVDDDSESNRADSRRLDA